MHVLKEFKRQTIEEKIEQFDKNQYIANLEESIFKIDTDFNRVKNIFLFLLDNHNDINVPELPEFLFNERIIKIKTRLIEESEIVKYFNKFEKIFIYTITESPNVKNLDNSNFRFLVLRYSTIPENKT